MSTESFPQGLRFAWLLGVGGHVLLRRRAVGIAAGLTTSLAFFCIGMLAMNVSQPAEDAYILFRYAENLSRGDGIVFNVGGSRAEGATDFLWLLALAALHLLGIDTVVASLLCNAAAAGVAAWLMVLALGKATGPIERVAMAVLIVPTLVMFHGAVASYFGFSAVFFGALALALIACALAEGALAARVLPFLALAAALVRPDGAILAATVFAWEAASAGIRRGVRDLLARWTPAILVGAAYFAWRWSYFGLPLPLPLYVKSRPIPMDGASSDFVLSSVLPSLELTLAWARSTHIWLLVPLAAAGLWLGRAAPRHWHNVLLAASPGAAHLLALTMAHQTQNISFRFQTPTTMIVIYTALLAATGVKVAPRARRVLLVCIGAALLLNLRSDFHGMRWMVREAGSVACYVAGFAPRVGRVLPREARVALTEAGRLPYWSEAEVLDVLGLNSPETVKGPVRLAQLKAFHPDIVMFHHARALSFPSNPQRLIELSGTELRAVVRAPLRRSFDNPPSTYVGTSIPGEQTVALVLSRYLSENASDFRILAVDYCDQGRRYHIYGVRRDFAGAGDFEADLRASLAIPMDHSVSYFQARDLAGSR